MVLKDVIDSGLGGQRSEYCIVGEGADDLVLSTVLMGAVVAALLESSASITFAATLFVVLAFIMRLRKIIQF